jgi:hypothetical protein
MEALQVLEDAEDAIVVVMPSTRPENIHPSGAIPGAIRSMVFAPHPWDFLIWAEDQGKVCLADLRSGLRTKQVILLDPDNEGYSRIDMEINASDAYSRRGDAELEHEHIRNFRAYRSLADDTGDSSFDIDDELAMAETRELAAGRSVARAAQRSEDTQLSRRERDLLDSLRTTAQAEERRSDGSNTRSIHYSELANESRRSTAQQSSLFAQDFPALARQNEETSASASTLPTAFRIMRDYMRERGEPLREPHSRPYIRTERQPRDPNAIMNLQLTAADLVDREDGEQAPTLSDRATLYQGDITRSSASRLLSNLRAAPHSTTGPQAAEILDSADARRRRTILRARERALASNATAAAAAADPARYHTRLSGVITRDYYDPALGLRTAGLSISKDGRKLWAACDKGIFEFEVNVRERMGMPAVQLK